MAGPAQNKLKIRLMWDLLICFYLDQPDPVWETFFQALHDTCLPLVFASKTYLANFNGQPFELLGAPNFNI